MLYKAENLVSLAVDRLGSLTLIRELTAFRKRDIFKVAILQQSQKLGTIYLNIFHYIEKTST